MENYIVINGKKAELTEEQLEKLGIKVEKENPFEAVCDKIYLFITPSGKLERSRDNADNIDRSRHDVANYCRDESLMQQRALHETLDRLLWRFACENGELENPWNEKNLHWNIIRTVDGQFYVCQVDHAKYRETYFPSNKIAQRAIDEIIKPFMKEHPDFVW